MMFEQIEKGHCFIDEGPDRLGVVDFGWQGCGSIQRWVKWLMPDLEGINLLQSVDLVTLQGLSIFENIKNDNPCFRAKSAPLLKKLLSVLTSLW
jgi:hypothetical protein